MRALNLFLNLTATAALIAVGVATFIRPAWLPALHLTALDAQLVVMQLLSFLMLLACLQKNVSRGWRIFTLAGS
ncbi:MAG: hypothetical protein ACYCW6_14560, partial [Candidatus Xenobia bacterium]